MLAGPLFSREALTVPRRLRHYLLRSGYLAALLVLMYTIRQATIGFQEVQSAGDIARYGQLVFSVFALLQLALMMFFATVLTASNIAQEKDRRTLVLLLMTDLRNREFAVGKLLASLLNAGVLLAVSIPAFCLLTLLGGVTLRQVMWVELIVAASALAAGSWGLLVGFWRSKTFQILAISVLGIVLFPAVCELLAAIIGPDSTVGLWILRANPFRAMFEVLNPLDSTNSGVARISGIGSVAICLSITVLLNLWTILRLRVWNPSRALRQTQIADESASIAEAAVADGTATEAQRKAKPRTRVQHKTVWTNPVIWREIRTRAYGRKVAVIKLAYIALAVGVGWMATSGGSGGGGAGTQVLGMLSPAAFAFMGIGILSLILINAQSVTSLTTEKDEKTLDLLLATDISAKEFVFGKIGGALYNTREMIVVPIGVLIWMLVSGSTPGLTGEYFVYILIVWLVLVFFAVMLGQHAGLAFDNSRGAIGNSLGTMFFLFVGILIFMLLLVEARSSFAIQFQSFVVFIGVGSIGLFLSLTHKNPSNALTLAAGLLPFLTFYAITDFLLGGSLGVCLWVSAAYGFAAIAMLVPAVSDFDVALGRTTSDSE